ncbi:MAG: MFS transporter, partial [Chryseobacterium taeanense]
INMMIVIPMLIQTLSFGFIFNSFLASNPSWAIVLAGILFVVAGGCVFIMKPASYKINNLS